MALISGDEKFKRENDERKLAWKKLRQISEYVQDYKLPKTNDNKKILQDRWGFWPLDNPDDENASFEFLNFFSNYNEKVNRFISPINWNGLDYFDVGVDQKDPKNRDNNGNIKENLENDTLYDPNGYVCMKISEFNPVIKIEIDLTFPVEVLVNEFRNNIISFQEMLQIKTQITQTHNHLEYLIICLKKLNLDNKTIIKRLLNQSNDDTNPLNKKYTSSIRNAEIETIRRMIKKHETV